MRLKWACQKLNDTIDITEENAAKLPVIHAEAPFGILQISVWGGRIYKDNTRQWMIYLDCSYGDTKEVITLRKIRGHLPDAIHKAEEILFSKPFDGLEVTS